MTKLTLLELLQQDIDDLKGLINCRKNLSENLVETQARAIILNLEDHLEELAQS